MAKRMKVETAAPEDTVKKGVVALSIMMAVTTVGGVSAQSMMGGSSTGGMMGSGSFGGMMGGGMMGAWDYIPPNAGKPLTLDQAVEQAQKYLDSWGNPGLRLTEVMEFSNHFYVEVGETGTDRKALELLLNKYTGAVFAEPGPNMLWNLKYGQMSGGMMGGLVQPDQGTTLPVTAAKAHQLAQSVLDSQRQGLKVEDGQDQFYGYYTIHVLKDGNTFGMLGVNGYTGQVWLHTWHGQFIAVKEIAPMR